MQRWHARVGSAGYDESIDYVAAAMAAAGYNVTIQPSST
jgi:hypothetical protein